MLELGFIGVVLRLTQIGRRRAWHRRWLETRRLAELLRVAAALAPAGGGPPIAPGEGPDAEGAWTEWYARSSLREVHVPDLTADPDHLRAMADGFVAGLIDGQIRYHRENTTRLLALHHGLDRIGMMLFWATFAIGVAFVVSVASFKAVQWLGIVDFEHGRFHEEFHRLHEIFEHWVKPAVMLCSAGFPALGAALYGIRAQGDYDASASRSEATARALVAVRGRIVDALPKSGLRRSCADCLRKPPRSCNPTSPTGGRSTAIGRSRFRRRGHHEPHPASLVRCGGPASPRLRLRSRGSRTGAVLAAAASGRRVVGLDDTPAPGGGDRVGQRAALLPARRPR